MTFHFMQGAWWVWPVALALYLLFRLWYDNWRGPLSAQEVAHFMHIAQASPGADHTDMKVMRDFLENDDGKEFVMCNLVKLHAGHVAHPVTGQSSQPLELLQEYFKQFRPGLLRKAGHPVIISRQAAGYVDAWNAPPDPKWSIAGMMRYRSRRDMIVLATSENFNRAYPFKVAALSQTFSFPTQVVLEMVLRPRGAVGLGLLLLASLIHLASLLIKGI
jgi:hypothetical protein